MFFLNCKNSKNQILKAQLCIHLISVKTCFIFSKQYAPFIEVLMGLVCVKCLSHQLLKNDKVHKCPTDSLPLLTTQQAAGSQQMSITGEAAVEGLGSISSKPQPLGWPHPQLIPDNLVLFDFGTT